MLLEGSSGTKFNDSGFQLRQKHLNRVCSRWNASLSYRSRGCLRESAISNSSTQKTDNSNLGTNASISVQARLHSSLTGTVAD